MITLPLTSRAPRRKAVWGAKRALAALAILSIGLAPDATAAGRHAQNGATAKPGVPSQRVKSYKLDNELSRRSLYGNPLFTTSVIVTLVPGATLPPEFKKFARLEKLGFSQAQLREGALELLHEEEWASVPGRTPPGATEGPASPTSPEAKGQGTLRNAGPAVPPDSPSTPEP